MIRAVLVFMALFFFIGIMFTILAVPMEALYNISYDLAGNMNLEASEVTRVRQHQDNILATWWLVPFILLIVLVVWIFVQAQRREYEYYPQG